MSSRIARATQRKPVLKNKKTKQNIISIQIKLIPREAEAGRSLSSRPAWSTELVPGQLRLLHRETLSQIHTHTHTGNTGAREMAQQFRVLAALAEELGLVSTSGSKCQ